VQYCIARRRSQKNLAENMQCLLAEMKNECRNARNVKALFQDEDFLYLHILCELRTTLFVFSHARTEKAPLVKKCNFSANA
jgi:hypothetical protein